jgi:predicted transcriptional regulator
MPIVWRNGQATVKQVHRELLDWRDIAYTTVMTTMERLTEKGVLTREARSRLHLHARMRREEYAAQAVRQIIDEVLEWGCARPRTGTSLKHDAGGAPHLLRWYQ